MNYRCEDCYEINDEKDWGNTGFLNGNLKICPSCGSIDSIDPDFYETDEDKEEEED